MKRYCVHDESVFTVGNIRKTMKWPILHKQWLQHHRYVEGQYAWVAIDCLQRPLSGSLENPGLGVERIATMMGDLIAPKVQCLPNDPGVDNQGSVGKCELYEMFDLACSVSSSKKCYCILGMQLPKYEHDGKLHSQKRSSRKPTRKLRHHIRRASTCSCR